MQASRIFYFLLFFTLLHSIEAQSDRHIYSELKKHNVSVYDIKDSTLYIEVLYVNSFKGDTLYYQFAFHLLSHKPNHHEYEISSPYWIHEVKNEQWISYSNKWNNKDSPELLKPYNLNSFYNTSVFYPLNKLPKKKNNEFKSSQYGKYKIHSNADTFVLEQAYKHNSFRKRILHFDKEYNIIRIQGYNENPEEPDAYVETNIHYFRHDCFDSLNRVKKLGPYTPTRAKAIIQDNPIDTVTKHSKKIFIQGDSFILNTGKKYFLIDFWYLSCSPCLKMMPDLKIIESSIDTSKIILLGVNRYDSEQTIQKIIKLKDIHTIQLDLQRNKWIDWVDEFPILVLYDSDLNEIKRFVGYSEGYTRRVILKYLNSLQLLKD